MPLEKARDIMTPLDQYAVVDESATIVDAFQALDRAQDLVPDDKQPHRAVLVRNAQGEITGKLGHHALLAGMEPRYLDLGKKKKSTRDGYSTDFLMSFAGQMPLWQDDFDTYARRAISTRVTEVMHPIAEHIDIDAPIGEVIHQILTYDALSLLVMEQGRPVGMLRVSDLFSVVSKNIRRRAEELSGEE
jgi:hypothetical protein